LQAPIVDLEAGRAQPLRARVPSPVRPSRYRKRASPSGPAEQFAGFASAGGARASAALHGTRDYSLAMTPAKRGMVVVLGGLAWLAGVLILELTFDPDTDSLPLSFSLLATFAGAAVGWGCWRAASELDGGLGRLGMRATAACSAALGLGFGFDLIPNFWIGFLLAYSFGLFILPVALLLLGIGVVRSQVFPTWAKVVPFALLAVAAVTYGFHALARDVWDPSDAIWYFAIGVGWVLLGVAIARFPHRIAGATPLEPAGRAAA